MGIFSSIKNWVKKTFGGGGSSSTRRASRVSNYGGGGSRSYSDYSGGGYSDDYEARKKREARQRKERKKKQESVTNALASISKRTDSLASGKSPSRAASATKPSDGTARVLAKISEKSKAAPPDPKEKARKEVQKKANEKLKQISDDRKEYNKATGNKYNVDKNGTKARIAQKSQAYDVKAEKYETEKHPIATSFGRGALSGVTFGGSEILAQTSKNRKKSGAEAHYQKNKNSKAELAGELAGSLAGFGLTGEASARAVGKVAPKAVKNLGTRGAEKLASSSAIRRAAEKEAVKRFGAEGATKEVINQIAKRRATTAMTELGKDAAINLTTGLASDLSHSALESDNLKDFAKNMGRNAAMNVALGGATSLVPAFRVGRRFDDAVEGAAKKADGAIDALLPVKRSGDADNVKVSLNRRRTTDVRMPEVRPTEITPPEVRPQTVEQAPQMFQPSEALRELDGKGETWLGSYGHITANQDGSYNLFVNGVGDRTLGRAEAEDYISRAVARLNADEEAIRATRTSPLTDAETARISEIDDEIARLRADGLEDANAIKDSKYKGVEKYWERQGERGRRETELTREKDAILRKEPPQANGGEVKAAPPMDDQTVQEEAARAVEENFERSNPSAEMPRVDEDPSQFAQIDEGMAGIDAEAEKQAQRRMPQTEEERLATKIEEKETGRKMTNEEISVRNENRERLKLKEQEVKPRKMPKGERLTSKVAKKVEGATFEEATKPASAKEIINAEKTYVRGQASNYEKVTSRGGTALMSATGNEAETKVVKDLIDENAFQYARVKNKEKYEWAVKEFVNDKEAVSKKMLKYADDIDSIPTSQIVDTHYQAHAVMKMMRSQLDNPALSAEEREAAREIYGAAASLTQQLSSLSGQVNQFQGVMVHCDGKTRMRNAVDNIANILDSSRGFRTSKTGKSLSGNAFQRKNQIRDIIYSDPDASKALEKVIDAATEEEYGNAMQELLYATSKMNRKHALDYVQTWRYLAMLGNPKTHVRNILGNVTFGGIRQLSNTNRSLIEKRLETYAKRHGLEIERHGKTSITAFAEARKANPTTTAGKTAKEWFDKNKDAILSGAKYDENVAKGSDPAMMKWLTWLSDGNGKILEGEDNFFRARSYKESFIKSYSQYAKDGKEITDELLEKIHKSALKESQIATFNEFNSMAQVLSKWSHTTFNDSLGRKAAGWTVNAMMPFTKVPSNILKQSVNYSPIGVARGISNITNAAKTGDSEVFNRAIDELSSGLTGTAIAALGFFLGKSTDMFTTNAGSDDAAAKFKKLEGVQNYSVTFTDQKTGEKTSMTLDWLVPTSATFFAGVEMANQLKRGYGDLFEFVGDMSQVTSRVIEPVLETSMLSGLYNIVEGARNGTGEDEKQNFFSLTLRELTQSYANSLVPTVQGQLARTLYKSDKQLTGDGDWEYWINSLKNKMGIANTNLLGTEALGADTTAYGDVKNKKETAGDYAKSALKNFLSPANIQKVDIDETDEAKIKQYEDAVKNGADPQDMAYLFPKKQYKKEFTTGNLDVKMSNKDLSTYNQAKATGGAEGARYALESIMFNRYTKDERGYKHSTADAYTTEQKQKIIKQFEGKSIRDVEKWVRKQPQFKNADEAEQKKVIDGLWSYSKQGKSQSAKRAGEQAVIKAQGGDVDEYNFNNEITEKKREVLLPYIESGVVSYKDAVEFARLAGKTYYYEDDEGGHSQTYYNKGVMLDYLKSKGYDDETAAALFNSFKAWNAKEYGKSGGRRYGRRRRGYRRWHSHGGGSSKKATVPKPKTLKSSSLTKGKALVAKGSSSSRKATAPTLERVKAKIDLPTPRK
jgi:hypothetical protein